MAELLPVYFSIIAFFCALGAMALAIFHIYRHLSNYTEPTYQRYIVRIIFMVPVYALTSFLSLIFLESSIYFNSIREVYEAWVIYNFLSLCLAWVDGPGAVVLSLSGRVMKPSWCVMTCCLLLSTHTAGWGCLQFVILKPFLVAVTLILYAKGKYKDGNFNPKQSYLYLTIIYTISYTMALYALALFYVACKDLLQPFNPVPKFIIIKSVVFLTYWQGVLVFLATKSRFIKDAEEAVRFQDFIICIEMLIAAIGHLYAFSYKEYAGANIAGSCDLTCSLAHALKLNDLYHDTVHQGVLVFLATKSRFIKDAEEAARFQDFIICIEMLIAAIGHLYAFSYKEYAGANIAGSCDLTCSLAHALKLNDLYHDTVHQFAQTYHDYVLYNHTEGDEGTRKYRSRTFVPTGQEMDGVRKNKLMFGNKMDEVQLSSHSATRTSKNDISVPQS